MLQSRAILKRQLRRSEPVRRALANHYYPQQSSSSRTRSSFLALRSYFSTVSTQAVPYSTTAVVHQHSAAVLASTFDDDDDDDDYFEDQTEADHVERFLRDSMNQFLPNSNLSALDLELGEAAPSNGPWLVDVVDYDNDDDDEEDGILEEEEASKILDPKQSSAKHPAASPASSSFSEQSSSSFSDQKSVRELLASFDPAIPPILTEDGDRDKQLLDLQLWLECSAQHEALAKHRKVIEGARERKDYTSLSIVQRTMMKWLHKLQDEIEAYQHQYLSGDRSKRMVVSGTRFGPYICTLSASKLALITANVAIMQTLSLKSGPYGCSLTKLADNVGRTIEDEVVIHRMLHKRFQDAKAERQRSKQTNTDGDEEEELDISALAPLHDDLNQDKSAQEDNDKNAKVTGKWNYAASHLNRYLAELNHTEKSAKSRLNSKVALKKARKALVSEEDWPKSQRIQLGAVLVKCLLETATVTDDKGQEEPAFVLEKKWVKKHRIQSFVKMTDRLYELIVSDKLESLAATSSRHKPMIVPPQRWTRPHGGGYKILQVDMMRYHGCETQREALKRADLSTVCDGLNALGRVAWKINQPVLEAAWRCWNDNIPLGDIPDRTDFAVPDEPIQPEWPAGAEKGTQAYEDHVKDYKHYVEQKTKHMRILQKNNVCCFWLQDSVGN